MLGTIQVWWMLFSISSSQWCPGQIVGIFKNPHWNHFLNFLGLITQHWNVTWKLIIAPAAYPRRRGMIEYGRNPPENYRFIFMNNWIYPIMLFVHLFYSHIYSYPVLSSYVPIGKGREGKGNEFLWCSLSPTLYPLGTQKNHHPSMGR